MTITERTTIEEIFEYAADRGASGGTKVFADGDGVPVSAFVHVVGKEATAEFMAFVEAWVERRCSVMEDSRL